MRISAIALTATVMWPVAVHAQLCRGTAPFTTGPLAIGGSIELNGRVTRSLAQLSVGIPNAVFVAGSTGTVAIKAVEGKAKVVGGVAGYELSLTRTGRASVCAVGVVSHESAQDGVLRATARTGGGGLSIGGEVVFSPRVAVIPFASVVFSRTRSVLEDNVTQLARVVEMYWMTTFGLGIVLYDGITIHSGIRIPFGTEIVDPSFILATQINLGGWRR